MAFITTKLDEMHSTTVQTTFIQRDVGSLRKSIVKHVSVILRHAAGKSVSKTKKPRIACGDIVIKLRKLRKTILEVQKTTGLG